ncbi:mCG148424 [Mus musculus]|nr:mCG148424 [Mus musculus]
MRGWKGGSALRKSIHYTEPEFRSQHHLFWPTKPVTPTREI